MAYYDPYNNNLKKTTKRFLIYLAILFLVFIFVSAIFLKLGFPMWAVIIFNVVIGGGIILIVEIIYKKVQSKKTAKRVKNDDPFA